VKGRLPVPLLALELRRYLAQPDHGPVEVGERDEPLGDLTLLGVVSRQPLGLQHPVAHGAWVQ
jgi:hypothetical protein